MIKKKTEEVKSGSVRCPVIIPAYQPSSYLPTLCEKLIERGAEAIVLVDDGSGEEFRGIFDAAEKTGRVELVRHKKNRGKGRALKNAFARVLKTFPSAIGAVTADADGQHTPEDILRCAQALADHPESLVLGCRTFDRSVPFHNRAGNLITCTVCRLLVGVDVTDTQTGLRGIPRQFMKHLLHVPGDRFEFETLMLMESKGRAPFYEVPIRTVYEEAEDSHSHFNVIKDSIKIYRVILSYALLHGRAKGKCGA